MDKTQYLDNVDGQTAGLVSPDVWADCPVLDILLDPSVGWHHYETWTGATHSYTSTGAANGYNTYFESAGDGAVVTAEITSLTDGILRPLAVTSDEVEDDEAVIQWLDQTSVCFMIDEGEPKMWFEACIKTNLIALQSLFVGIAEQGSPASKILDDDGTGFAKDNIGFHVLQGASSTLIAGHGAANPTSLGTAQTLVKNTYYNLGMKFDGDDTMSFYINGVEKYSVSTGATDFPDGEDMAQCFGIKTHESVSKILSVGWWRGAALYA